MSICGGIAGWRGKNPVGIFFHNDAGSKNATKKYYDSWLKMHNLKNGFAHYYVCSDGTLQAEDDANKAWHCGQSNGNANYLSIEICQSMGNLTTFQKNEEAALQLAAQKCKQYGITPSMDTIRLHQEVSATDCPHRSVEIHGGRTATKQYFIDRIKAYMGETTVTTATETNMEDDDNMKCFYTVDGKGPVMYFDGYAVHPLAHQDEMTVLNNIYRDCTGKNIPCYSWSSKAPWYVRLKNAISR